MKFECPGCQRRLHAPDRSPPGATIQCPYCQCKIDLAQVVEATDARPKVGAADIVYCVHCGQKNPENNFKCVGCGSELHGSPARSEARREAPDEADLLGGLIPYKNRQALLAYYFGVFALIPCLGIPLGIVAIVLGVRGLKFANLHPEARGKAHALTGIILGSICTLGHSVLTILAIMTITDTTLAF